VGICVGLVPDCGVASLKWGTEVYGVIVSNLNLTGFTSHI
jgi:hypothetical protein